MKGPRGSRARAVGNTWWESKKVFPKSGDCFEHIPNYLGRYPSGRFLLTCLWCLLLSSHLVTLKLRSTIQLMHVGLRCCRLPSLCRAQSSAVGKAEYASDSRGRWGPFQQQRRQNASTGCGVIGTLRACEVCYLGTDRGSASPLDK